MKEQQEQEWEYKKGYHISQEEGQKLQEMPHQTNGWDVLILLTERLFDWLEGIDWRKTTGIVIIIATLIATILIELITHWH